jgi:hypothetical protein
MIAIKCRIYENVSVIVFENKIVRRISERKNGEDGEQRKLQTMTFNNFHVSCNIIKVIKSRK